MKILRYLFPKKVCYNNNSNDVTFHTCSSSIKKMYITQADASTLCVCDVIFTSSFFLAFREKALEHFGLNEKFRARQVQESGAAQRELKFIARYSGSKNVALRCFVFFLSFSLFHFSYAHFERDATKARKKAALSAGNPRGGDREKKNHDKTKKTRQRRGRKQRETVIFLCFWRRVLNSRQHEREREIIITAVTKMRQQPGREKSTISYFTSPLFFDSLFVSSLTSVYYSLIRCFFFQLRNLPVVQFECQTIDGVRLLARNATGCDT